MNRSNLHLVSYNSSYENAMNELLSLCFIDDESISYFKRGNLHQCILAKRDELLLGAINIWNSSIHSHCHYFSIVVHPLNQERKLVMRLLNDAIETFRLNQFPLQTSIWETNCFLGDFYKSFEFTEIRRTYISSLNIANLPKLDDEIIQMHSDYLGKVMNFSEIALNQELKDQLISFVKKIYVETHKDNPPTIFDLRVWERLTFSPDIISDASYVLLSKSGDIIAFAMLHKGEEPHPLEFGWRGTIKEANYNGLMFLNALQIRYARENGYRDIKGEFDTTDPYCMDLFNVFSFSPVPTFITYQKTK